jgi:hypothetical protein
MTAQPNPDATFTWRRSSASGGSGNCVEVARSASSVLVRDSSDQAGPRLRFSQAEWRRFTRGIKNGKSTRA